MLIERCTDSFCTVSLILWNKDTTCVVTLSVHSGYDTRGCQLLVVSLIYATAKYIPSYKDIHTSFTSIPLQKNKSVNLGGE